ncbi:MAG: hypothetical protein ABGX04_03285 [Myxococcales bacterium]|nr:hypothetical protein [Myxococcales bacterium]HIK85411.1 hypothetical protein [Myxococcales bacterium]
MGEREENEERHQRSGRGRSWIAAFFVVLIIGLASPVTADEYEEDNAGHPVRVLAYVLYPVGVVIDYVLMRPAHWLVSHEPLKTFFGHED